MKKKVLCAFVIICLLFLSVGSVLTIPFFTRNQTTITPPDSSSNLIDTSDTSKNSITPPDTSEIIDTPPSELPSWYGYPNEPYAIIEIEEITDKTFTSYEWFNHKGEYVMLKCKIIASFHTSKFYGDPSLDGSGTKYVPFDEIGEIYVTERSVDLFVAAKTVLIYVDKRNLDGKNCFHPPVNNDGMSEFLSIVDGKLQLKEADYNTKSFVAFEELNRAFDDYRGKDSNIGKAMPKKKIGDGMTIDEIIEYFNAWDEAYQVYLKNRNPNFCN